MQYLDSNWRKFRTAKVAAYKQPQHNRNSAHGLQLRPLHKCMIVKNESIAGSDVDSQSSTA